MDLQIRLLGACSSQICAGSHEQYHHILQDFAKLAILYLQFPYKFENQQKVTLQDNVDTILDDIATFTSKLVICSTRRRFTSKLVLFLAHAHSPIKYILVLKSKSLRRLHDFKYTIILLRTFQICYC